MVNKTLLHQALCYKQWFIWITKALLHHALCYIQSTEWLIKTLLPQLRYHIVHRYWIAANLRFFSNKRYWVIVQLWKIPTFAMFNCELPVTCKLYKYLKKSLRLCISSLILKVKSVTHWLQLKLKFYIWRKLGFMIQMVNVLAKSSNNHIWMQFYREKVNHF